MQRPANHDSAWVTGQFALVGGTLVASLIEVSRSKMSPPSPLRWVRRCIGTGLLATALAIAARARRDLGSSFSMAPTPIAQGTLVDTGIYSIVRHPMYLSVLLMVGSWAIVTRTRSALIGLAASTLFFHTKARHEEELLMERYPDYASFQARVRPRIIPWRR